MVQRIRFRSNVSKLVVVKIGVRNWKKKLRTVENLVAFLPTDKDVNSCDENREHCWRSNSTFFYSTFDDNFRQFYFHFVSY